MWACSLKPSSPKQLQWRLLQGWAFLNLFWLYISSCEYQFRNEQAKIHWALSFMKLECATLYMNCILQREAEEDIPFFLPW
jgi:hypothetical protein